MDEDNMEELERIKPDNCRATVELLGEHDPQGEKIIRDPYYVRTFFIVKIRIIIQYKKKKLLRFILT